MTAPERLEADLKFLEEEAMRFAKGRGGPVAAKLRAVATNYAALAAEKERLERELDAYKPRHPNPADFRYWEGRYRDEAARVRSLEEALTWIHDGAHTKGHTLPQIKERAAAALSTSKEGSE